MSARPGRRTTLAVLASSVALGTAIARAVLAQGGRTRVVGMLTAGQGQKFLAPALATHGWVEGGNVRYEVRRMAPDAAGLDEAALELVRAGVDVLVGSGANHVLALRRATQTVPIICGGISDPVGEGVARSLRQPGMNVTGLSFGLTEAAVLQIGTLRALLPGLKRVAFITTGGDGDRPAPAHQAAAKDLGVEAYLVKIATLAELDRALAAMRPVSEAAWLAQMPRDTTAAQVAGSALKRRIATHARDIAAVRAGILMSYWIVHSDPLGRVAAIVDRVLRGADPGTIPFELPDKTQFALNRATARELGLRVTDDLLLRATEVHG